MIGHFATVLLVALLIAALAGWATQGATVAFVLSLAGMPGCF